MTSWTAAYQAPLSFTISQSLLRFMSIEPVTPSKHFICRLLLLLPSIFPSIRVFFNESALHIRWPKSWSFPDGSGGKESVCNEGYSGHEFNPWVGKIPWRREWYSCLENFMDRGAWWATVLVVPKSWTQLNNYH